MLCSTPKPTKSSWLDRLRTSKGFTTAAADDLDHFLASINPNPSPDTPPQPPPAPPQPPPPAAAATPTPTDLLTTALADLFVMAAPGPPRRRPPHQKKQRRPKHLRVPSSGESGVVPEARRRKRVAAGARDVDLAGYSRTDVTVIDTSLVGWKAEKVIFRKGAVWKVRDKKARVGWRKKRKVGLMERLVGDKEEASSTTRTNVPSCPNSIPSGT